MKQNVQDERFEALQAWLANTLAIPVTHVFPLVGDASFRRYFRVHSGDHTYIAMDAPPERESCDSFIAIAKTFYKMGLNVPVIHFEDRKNGFLLLTDFGDRLYIDVLNEKTADNLYRCAIDNLLLIQSCQKIEDYVLPQFTSDLYYQEMSLFPNWYLKKYLKIKLSASASEILENVFQLLIKSALSQPQTCVHRDYHSRNLMVVADQCRPGILDFQDALLGPVTYDLLSLLRDCYIEWPHERIEFWVSHYQRQAYQWGILKEKIDKKEFMRWFDWIGLQRHLKCAGLFARLSERDGKPKYLQYIPRVMRYIENICSRYREFKALKLLLENS